MSRIFHDLEVGLDESLAEKISRLVPAPSHYRILRQSVDARRHSRRRSRAPHFVYTVEVFENNEPIRVDEVEPLAAVRFPHPKPIIIGAGPAGLFAALRLVERGVPCIIVERGSEAEKRMLKINRFWRYGELDSEDNVCFGEGGAGLYSDGKLMTRIKSPHIPYVLKTLVAHGAPEEILWLANPHVGSDRIRRVIPRLRQYLMAQGAEILFQQRVDSLIIKDHQVQGVRLASGKELLARHVVVATGHSAFDFYYHLDSLGVTLEAKAFAVGLRVEHPQSLINRAQYREFAEHPKLGAAAYHLTHHDHQTGVGVYSFCMCPGGYVVASTSEAGAVVCNGMSNFRRNSPYANSGIVVTVPVSSDKNVFAGIEFMRGLEKAAYSRVVAAGGQKEIPVQTIHDFLAGRAGVALKSSSPSGVVSVRLDEVLPEAIVKALSTALEKFDQKINGFISPLGQLHGMETRTSSALRILRNPKTLESVSHGGLFPAGEGAGYAGGITSAACDGIRVAEAILQQA